MKKILMVVALLGCLVSLNAQVYKTVYSKDGSIRKDTASCAHYEDSEDSENALDYELGLWVDKPDYHRDLMFFDTFEDVAKYFRIHGKRNSYEWLAMRDYKNDKEIQSVIIVDTKEYPYVMKKCAEQKWYPSGKYTQMKKRQFAALITTADK